MEKVQITQDTLYEYMLAHNIKMIRLAELIDKDPDVVTSCFSHRKDRYGTPRKFTSQNIQLINKALPQIALELRKNLLSFGSPKTFTSGHGTIFDPGLIEPINELGKYLNITGIFVRLCGWSKSKKTSVFGRPAAKNYGHISLEDANRINAEILSIAGVLSGYEVVPD